MMPLLAPLPQDNSHSQQYLRELIKLHPLSSNKIDQILSGATQLCQEKIQSGRYQINPNGPIVHSRTNTSLNNKSPQRHSYKPGETCKEEGEMENRKRAQFMREIKKERLILATKREEHLRSAEAKQKLKEEQEKRESQKIAQQMKQIKRKQLQKKIQQIHESKLKREQQCIAHNKELKQKYKEKSLLQKMEESYHHQQDISLEEKKKRLAEIRELHKPISREELEQHADKIAQYKSVRSRAVVNELPEKKEFYKSSWHQILAAQKTDEIRHKETEAEIQKDLKEKQKRYAAYIRSNFVPETDPKITEELLKPKMNSIRRLDSQQIREAGLRNLRYSKEHTSKEERVEQIDEPLLKSQTGKIDYLEQMRKARVHEDEVERISRSSKLSEVEKITKIVAYADDLQRKARQKQELSRAKGGTSEELDDLYIKALAAKLKALN